MAEVPVEWERRVREQPWYSLPADHRIDSLPEVVVGLVEASLCSPQDADAHHHNVLAAAAHGTHRREQGVPEPMILTEYHLLRTAPWPYLSRTLGAWDRVTEAIVRIAAAISLATNASMRDHRRSEADR